MREVETIVINIISSCSCIFFLIFFFGPGKLCGGLRVQTDGPFSSFIYSNMSSHVAAIRVSVCLRVRICEYVWGGKGFVTM